MARNKEDFVWRDSPGIIAQYFRGTEVPSKVELTLGPNEICVVLENGSVVGTATQTRMEVNPKLGLLRRVFGQNSPDRAFLFAETGPHEVILMLKGITSDGQNVIGHARIRVTLDRESAAKILKTTTKGSGSFTLGSVAEAVEQEANHHLGNQILQSTNLSDLRGEDATEDSSSALRSGLKSSLENLGFRLDNAWVSWNETEAEKLVGMRNDLENLVERNAILTETEFEQIETSYKMHMQELELEAKLKVAGQAATERAKAEVELAKIRARAEIDKQSWESIKSLRVDREQTRMNLESAQADHEIEVARKNLERDRFATEIHHEGKDKNAKRTMDMFEQVQARKRDRIAMQQGQENKRLETQERSSQRMIDTLMLVIESTDDDTVRMEAIKQLSLLRRADVEGTRASKDD
jgi:hypothetical protein